MAKVNEQKHLGLILDSKLTFEKHLNEKIIKAKKNVGVLKHLSKFLPLKTLDQMYKALVRSHFDHCDIIYHIPSNLNQAPLGVTLNSLMEKVERIQYQAALGISGDRHGSSRVKLFEELELETLSDRRMGRRNLQTHKILNNKTPSYLHDKLPPAEPCSVGTFITLFVKYCVNQIDTCTVFSLMQLPLGIYLSNILMVCRLVPSLKNILIHFIVPIPKVFSVYMIL